MDNSPARPVKALMPQNYTAIFYARNLSRMLKLCSWVDHYAVAGTVTARLEARLKSVELLRIVAAFGIVAFHSNAGGVGTIGYAGLIVFLFLSAYFECRTRATDISGAWRKLMIPWAIWSVVFAAENTLKSGRVFSSHLPALSQLLTGPSLHLWFLPFVFSVTAALRCLKPSVSASVIGWVATFASALLVLTLPRWLPWCSSLAPPAPQYGFAAIPVLAGTAIAATPFPGLFILIPSLLVAAVLQPSIAVTIYAVGFGLSLLALSTGNRLLPTNFRPQVLSRYMLGVYLAHPMFLSLVQRCLPTEPALVRAMVTFALALLTTWFITGGAVALLARRTVDARIRQAPSS